MGNKKGVVLVVDDSPSIRGQVKIILEKDGYSVREAGNKFGMLNSMDTYGHLVDLILMDLVIKSEYGLDLVEELKKDDKYNNIPVIILTEHADRDEVNKAKKIGVEGFIVKPINASILKEKVEVTIKKS